MGGAPIFGGCLSVDICNNQPNDGVDGGGALERRCERAERVGEDMYPSFRAAIRVTKK